MVRYWKVGTSAHKMIEVFAKVSEECFLGMQFHIIKGFNNKYQLVDKNQLPIYEFNSYSTASQYLKTWEALGFISQPQPNKFKIATNLKEVNDLYNLTIIFLTRESAIDYVRAYRQTLIINILVEAKVLNAKTLNKKTIVKKRGKFTIEDVEASISKYEKTLSAQSRLVENLSNVFEKKF